MSLEEEIRHAKTEVVSDGYEMSVGEIANLYKDGELIVSPAFQRLFRWDSERKSRFIESLLLGIPIPPIFVYQDGQGKWELIDGLQRLSTILEFMGVLKDTDGALYPPAILDATRFLPSLKGASWDDVEDVETAPIGSSLQLLVKRARLRVEILKNESDPKAKFELFQRLNTGGAILSPQEVRNCVAVMLNETFYKWLVARASDSNFVNVIDQTQAAATKQSGQELALRFFAFRNIPYRNNLNVHEYLDEAIIELASDADFNEESEESVFRKTFLLINESMGDKAFKKWNGTDFSGMFLMSVFEVVATGVSHNIDRILGLGTEEAKNFILEKTRSLWDNPTFKANNGAGVRGTTRLANLLPLASDYFNVK